MRLERASFEQVVSPTAEPSLPTMLVALIAPLPNLGALDRMLLRGMAIAGLAKVSALRGLEHIGPDRDPFILALNHNSRQEALLLPPLLFLLRSGRRIHFLADWNFRLIPGIDFLYRRAGAITVTRKPAKPRLLNVMKPFFADALPAFEQARRHLIAGRSVGIFPEGTVNRDPWQLLRGRYGAARLSLETGVPLIPAGIRFSPKPGATASEGRMDIVVGPAMPTPSVGPKSVTFADVQARHAEMMSAISLLAGKSWAHTTQETHHDAV
jgi:1-acyl-sn-glycerol-3-phosphate acyltransferase